MNKLEKAIGITGALILAGVAGAMVLSFFFLLGSALHLALFGR